MAAASMRIDPIKSSRFSSAASFRRSMYSSMSPAILLKFAAANSARGGRQPANGSADAHGEEISNENGSKNDHADERQRLPVEFSHSGVRLRLLEASLRDDGPIHFRKSAVGSDHLNRVFLVGFGKAHRLRVAKFLRQRFHSRDQ